MTENQRLLMFLIVGLLVGVFVVYPMTQLLNPTPEDKLYDYTLNNGKMTVNNVDYMRAVGVIFTVTKVGTETHSAIAVSESGNMELGLMAETDEERDWIDSLQVGDKISVDRDGKWKTE